MLSKGHQTAVVSVSRPTMLSKGPPTAVVSRPTMLSKGPPTAILMSKYYAFKGAPNSNFNV